MAKDKHCLIIGTGRLGSRIASLMFEVGYQVHTINRNICKLPATYNRYALDIGSTTMQFDLPIKFDHVFFTAAPDSHNEEAYRKIYIQTLVQLASVLQNARHVYFASSTGVYHQNNGEIVDETSPTNPTRFSGKIMLEAETWLQKHIKNYTILRLSGLYDQTGSRMIKLLSKKGEIDYTRISNRIHLDDAASAFLHISKQKKKDSLYIASDPNPSSNWDIANWYAEQTGTMFTQKEPQSLTNKLLSSKKLVSTGYGFQYPSFREGLKACL